MELYCNNIYLYLYFYPQELTLLSKIKIYIIIFFINIYRFIFNTFIFYFILEKLLQYYLYYLMLYYYVFHIIIFLTIIIKFIVLKNPVKSSFLQQYPYPTLFSFPISGRLTLVVYVLRQGGAS